jgi:hypothetical protein
VRRQGLEQKSSRIYVSRFTALSPLFGRKENKTKEEDMEKGGRKEGKGINNSNELY